MLFEDEASTCGDAGAGGVDNFAVNDPAVVCTGAAVDDGNCSSLGFAFTSGDCCDDGDVFEWAAASMGVFPSTVLMFTQSFRAVV